MGIIESGSSIFVLCCVQVAIIAGDTILYTNSPRHLVTSENYTSYKLAVPGANPITIIEATQGPPKDDVDTSAPAPGLLNEMRRQNWIRDEEFLFRRKQESDRDKENERIRTTVYSPDLLKKFLDDYADKVKKPSESAASTDKKEKLQEILLFDDDNEDENFPLNSQPEEKYGHQQWGQKNKHKYDTDQRYDRPNSGWVTMDVIPWSSSKVSKWQGQVQKLPSRPQTDYSRPDYVSVEDFDDDRYNSNYRPSRPNYGDYDEVDRFSSSSSSGGYNKYNKYHEKKPYYDYQASASSNNNNYHHQQPHHHSSSSGESTTNKDIYRPWRGDIITDNRAPDFPDHHHHSSAYPNKKRRPASASSPYDNYSSGENRPYNYNSHHPQPRPRPTDSPESGNGEWILVSTTKGYHFPRHGQRAIAMKPPSFTGHKSVQLSVTNPNKVSTFSFDSDQHHHLYGGDQSGEQSMHSTTVTAAAPVKKTTTTVQKKKVVKKVFPVKSPGVDSSAVLAAVGAGMVPATVAMLMPMLAGRRRRKRDLFAARNVTHFPDLDYEETLPRIILHVR